MALLGLHATMSSSSSSYAAAASPFPPPLRRLLRRSLHLKPQTLSTRRSQSAVRSSLSDPLVLKIADKLEDSLTLSNSSPAPALHKLRESAAQSLLSKPWPSTKDEPFRFTDTSYIKNSDILPVPLPAASSPSSSAAPSSPSPHFLALVDGHVAPALSRLSALPAGAYAGGISGIPPGPRLDRVLAALASGDGDLFSDLNGVGAPDVAVVYVPAGARIVDGPVHLMFCSAEGAEAGTGRMSLSNPRVLVVVEKGAELAIVEEHRGATGNEEGCYWANSVMEIVIGEGGKVSHSYLQSQSRNAAHTKWTFARQESSSTYELFEISTGGRLSRHSLHIQQIGSDTVTQLSAFHVARSDQTQDLHSSLILDHPRGFSRQFHKCIVSHSSGHVVFDGNIRVNRFAQQTDAGQMTRTLLLAPRATANVKPNLQIVADDVKCTHGATISDLEESQLFYFLARGVDLKTARDALVFSFGAEVLAKIPFEPIRKIVSNQIKELLTAERVDS